MKVSGPLAQSYQFEHDGAGRILRQIDQDGRTVSFAYDSNGNLTAVTPPGKPLHQFDLTAVDLLAAYNPSTLGTGVVSTGYSYNLDQQLTRISRPDGRTIDLDYDSGGRLETVGLSEGTLRLSYDPQTGHLASASSPDGETIHYVYDGFLLNGATWSGPVSGTVTRTYDDSFHLVSISVNGADPILLQYDRDNLLVQAGSLTLQRNATNGLLTGTALGEVSTTQSYNDFGELSNFRASFEETPFYETTYSYDKAGRITEKVETVSNASLTLDYHYDSAGRLADVVQNGTAVAHYDYDENGNRTNEAGPAGTLPSTYDAQDRLLQHGNVTYTYSANGELATKAQNGVVVTYSYDELGNLRQVCLPSGITVSYVVDASGRRVGRRVNGILVQGFLYNELLSPVAELDGAGKVVTRFVYGSHSHVPDYLVKSGVTYRIVSDHLGSPRLVVDSETGEVAQRIDYDAFGRVTLDTNPGFQPFGFAGGLYDYQTGLVRFGARDYDPEVGRWSSKDPALLLGGETNLYSYVANDPINWSDISGLHKGDKTYGYPKDFWNWYHKNMKAPGDPDLGPEEADEWYEEWKDQGRPGPDNKGRRPNQQPSEYCPSSPEPVNSPSIPPLQVDPCTAIGAAVGSVTGALVGGTLGGAGGTLFAPGPGTVVGAAAGGTEGAIVGGALGGAVLGGLLGHFFCNGNGG